MDSAPENLAPAMENGGSEEATRPLKKPRIGGGGAKKVKKRVAEIVLVLAAMARVRAGEKPTEAEIDLMAEAREKLAELCEGLAPKDIVAGEAVKTVIEDLGMNSRVKDQKLGFKGPRLTIAERYSQTKRKMEETRKYTVQSSPITTPPLQTGFNSAAESRGTPHHTIRSIPLDKQSNQPNPVVGHVSTAMPTSVQYQLPSNNVKPSAVSNSFPGTSNLGRDLPSTSFPRADRPNGSSYAPQGQANAQSWTVHPQAPKSGPQQNKHPMHIPAKVGTTPQTNIPRVIPPRDQNFMPFLAQPAPGTLPVKPVNYSQPPSLPANTHNEIAKIVQKLLQPKLPDHPTWIPPSRDYMNKALTCQICQLTINDVDSALVCDACEKGYHTKCAHSSNQRGIPRGEWHCSKCLSLSNGKPLPPKYGRVMRSNIQVKGQLSSAGFQSVSDKKIGAIDPKLTQQNTTVNGSSALQSPSNIDSAVDSKTVDDAQNAQKVETSLLSNTIDEKPVLGNCTNSSLKSSEAAFASLDVASTESSSQLVNNSEPSSTRQEESMDPSSETVENKAECSQPPQESLVVDPPERSCHAEDDASGDLQDQKPTEMDLDKVKLNETSESALVNDNSKQDKQTTDLDKNDTSSATATETETSNEVVELSGTPTNEAANDVVEHSGTPTNETANEVVENFGTPNETANEVVEHSGTPTNVAANDVVEHSGNPMNETANEVVERSGTPTNETANVVVEQSGNPPNDSLSFKWVGNITQVVDEKTFYQTCQVDGVTYNLQDHALFTSDHGKMTPSKIKSMWEDTKTGSKWVIANRYIYPSDLPESLGRPCSSGSNEVYESNQDAIVTTGEMEGLCKVLPQTKYQEECGRRDQLSPESTTGLPPVYLCKWLYDEVKGSFQPISG